MAVRPILELSLITKEFDRPRYKARLSAFIEGFSLQAGTHVHQNDRPGLEHLCRYGSRPPIAISRLKRLDDGNYEYSLKYPLPNGSYKLVLSGQQLMARLVLLVPRPKIHLVKYYGVFASNSSWRSSIIPSSCPESNTSDPTLSATSSSSPDLSATLAHITSSSSFAILSELKPYSSFTFSDDHYFSPRMADNPRKRYLDWASLLKRVLVTMCWFARIVVIPEQSLHLLKSQLLLVKFSLISDCQLPDLHARNRVVRSRLSSFHKSLNEQHKCSAHMKMSGFAQVDVRYLRNETSPESMDK